jgi:hypothetical protein
MSETASGGVAGDEEAGPKGSLVPPDWGGPFETVARTPPGTR